MRLSVKAAAAAFGVLYGATALLVTSANLVWPNYAVAFLTFQESIHPGFHIGSGFGGVILETLYGLLCGAIFGAVLAWLYNRIVGKSTG